MEDVNQLSRMSDRDVRKELNAPYGPGHPSYPASAWQVQAELRAGSSNRPCELVGQLGFDVDDPLLALMARCREVILGYALFLETLMGPAPIRPPQTRSPGGCPISQIGRASRLFR